MGKGISPELSQEERGRHGWGALEARPSEGQRVQPELRQTAHLGTMTMLAPTYGSLFPTSCQASNTNISSKQKWGGQVPGLA